jgi:2-polyprenyl-6-methoxyphenol hydroxylase-like FAD-dependent oxidoreductase
MTFLSHTLDRCQVLVVGAGPTGLVVAAELLARGIDTRVIDRGAGIVLETRALALHARALEALDLMGLTDRFLARGHIVRRLRMYSRGKPLVNLNYRLNGSRFGYMLDIPQHDTEDLLRQRVSELGGIVDGNMELKGLSQESDRVIATVAEGSGTTRSISASYIVGCDGAHSRVRQELGLSFPGHAYEDDWLLADVRMDWARPEDEVHAFFRPDGLPLICFPMRNHQWRLVFPYAGARGRHPPTLEEIQRLVDLRAPEHVHVSDATWLANFRCSRRSTSVYRRGRVLLAGDAVHVHSPAGGQGMNTGILDAHNLAWKLALVASSRSPVSLLDTYAEERAPVATEVIGLTHTLVQLGTMRNAWKRALRDMLVPLVSRVEPVQRRAVRRMGQLQVTYRASSLTRADESTGCLRPGDRAPDVPVVIDGGTCTRLYEALRTGRHLVVVPGDTGLEPLETYMGTIDVALGTLDPPCRRVWLIRPDGYLAATGMPSIVDYFRGVLPEDSRVTAGGTWPSTAPVDRDQAPMLSS